MFSGVHGVRSLVFCALLCRSLFVFLCVLYLLAIVLSVLLSLSFGHCFVCSSVFIFWPLFCLFFCLYLLAFVLSVLRFTANNYPFGTFKLYVGWFMVLNATFNNISVISWRSVFIGGGNRSTRRKPLTCRKSLTNFIA